MPGVGGAHFHALGGFFPISHEDGTAWVLTVAKAGEADAVWLVEIDVLLAVSVVFPGVEEIYEALDLGEFDLVLLTVAAVVSVFRAVEVGVENAGVALRPEENQGVGERLEPSSDGRFECLERLRVVIIDQSHGVERVRQHQRMVEDGAEVVIAPRLARLMKAVVERGVEQAHAAVRGGEVALEEL